MVPPEYVQTMRKSMLNRCPVSSYDEVCKLFKKELGAMPEDVSYFSFSVCLSSYSTWVFYSFHSYHYICLGGRSLILVACWT